MENFQMYKLDLEEAEESEVKLLPSIGSRESEGTSENHVFLLH